MIRRRTRNRTISIGCACEEDTEACLIHGRRRTELQRNIGSNDWADVVENLHLGYPTITEHSLRRTAALAARRRIEEGQHCDVVKFVNDRGWLLIKMFLDYATDLQDWEHKQFLTYIAIWPAVLTQGETTSHGLKFSSRSGITKISKALKSEEQQQPAEKTEQPTEPLYVTKAKSATLGKMPQVRKLAPTSRGGKALIPMGAPLTSRAKKGGGGHHQTHKYDGKPWKELPAGERYKLRTGTRMSIAKAEFYLPDINEERIALGSDFIYEIKNDCKQRVRAPSGGRRAANGKRAC